MRDPNIFNKTRALPRMSWSPHNLYNLWQRSKPVQGETTFTRTDLTLFQQRWKAKRLVRAYHGDHINERLFKRWYLPENLPDIRTRRSSAITSPTNDSASLAAFSGRSDNLREIEKIKEREHDLALAPVGSLMFSEVERRLDVLIFRSCFASSVYQARQFIVHGRVLLNGVKENNPNTRLNPGDMFSVDPAAIPFLHEVKAPQEDVETSASEDSESSPSADSEEKAPPTLAAPGKYKLQGLTPFNLPPYASPWLFIPAYLEPSFTTCSAIYVRHPTARPGYSEIPTPYDADGEVVRLAWEWYAKVRPRMRGKKQAATGAKGAKR